MHIPELLSLLEAGGTAVAILGCLLGAFAILVFAPLIYIAVLSKGSAADRLVSIIKAWRERPSRKNRKGDMHRKFR